MKRVYYTSEIDDYLVNCEAILDDKFNFVKWDDFSVVFNGRWTDDFSVVFNGRWTDDYPIEIKERAAADVVLFAKDEAGMNCIEEVI